MEKKTTVSVIMPTYNRANMVGRAILSIIKQTYQDFELVIVDDCSTDNTAEIIKEFQKKDERIKYLRHEKNKGGSAARNTGIKASKGKYIAFLDSDDEYLLHNLEMRCKVRKKIPNSYGVIHDKFIKKTPLGDKILPYRGLKEKETLIRYVFSTQNEVQINALFVNKDVIEKNNLYLDVKLNRHQDLDFAISLREKTEFYFLDKTLSIWHTEESNGRISSRKDYSASVDLINKHIDKFEKEKDVLAKAYYKVAIWHLRIKQTKKAKSLLLDSIKNKFYIKSILLYLSIFMGDRWISFLFTMLNYKIKKQFNHNKNNKN